jgi:hypothetical protein
MRLLYSVYLMLEQLRRAFSPRNILAVAETSDTQSSVPDFCRNESEGTEKEPQER